MRMMKEWFVAPYAVKAQASTTSAPVVTVASTVWLNVAIVV